MAQRSVLGDDYNYEDDYFLNGDSTFDRAFNNMTSIYKTYIHADAFGRDQIEQTLRSDDPEGLRGFYRDLGEDLGVANLDQRIAVFNDKDHPFTDADFAQQDQFRQDIHNAYTALSDTDKARCFDGLQRCRDDVDLSVGLSSFEDDLEGLGFSRQEFDSVERQTSSGDKTTVIMGVIKENEQGQKDGAIGVAQKTENGVSYAVVGHGSKKLPGAENYEASVDTNTGHAGVSGVQGQAGVSAQAGQQAGTVAGSFGMNGIAGAAGAAGQHGQAGVASGASVNGVAGGEGQRVQAGVGSQATMGAMYRQVGESKYSFAAESLENQTVDDVAAKREQRVNQATNLLSSLVKKPSMESGFDMEK